MIIALEGEIFLKEPTRIALKCAGVVYEVFISLQTSNQINAKVGEKVVLHTSHIIREDAQVLFGFVDLIEKSLFERLIKIMHEGFPLKIFHTGDNGGFYTYAAYFPESEVSVDRKSVV